MKFIEEEKYKDKVGIYLITNQINHNVYIGQTNDRFIERYWNHKWKLNNNSHDNIYLQNSWNKYGEENFTYSILHILSNNDNINELERYYINKFKLITSVYNIQKGGQDHTNKGKILSEETKRKIGESNKIKNLGKKASIKTKEKMSKARKNKTPWKKCLLSKEQAITIKEKLLKGFTPRVVSNELGIDYKIINNIYSSNTYKSAYVDGWDEFYNSRDKERKR